MSRPEPPRATGLVSAGQTMEVMPIRARASPIVFVTSLASPGGGVNHAALLQVEAYERPHVGQAAVPTRHQGGAAAVRCAQRGGRAYSGGAPRFVGAATVRTRPINPSTPETPFCSICSSTGCRREGLHGSWWRNPAILLRLPKAETAARHGPGPELGDVVCRSAGARVGRWAAVWPS